MESMRVSQGLFSDPMFSDFYCKAESGIYLPHIDPEEAIGVQVNCNNRFGTNIITCHDPRIKSFLQEVGGLSFDTAPSKCASIQERYIPIFDFRTIEVAHSISSNLVGLTLRDIFKNPLKTIAGQYQIRKLSFRDAEYIQKLCAKKKVILFLTGQDVLIETVWHQRSVIELFNQLKLMGFWAVTGFNFSVFGGECPIAQRINQKKSLVSSMLIEKNGMLPIPHVYAVNDFHIVRYQQWLKDNPHIQLITMNCQMQHTGKDIRQLVSAIKAMLNVNEKLQIILQGYWFSEMYRLGDFQYRIHIAESKPVKCGQSFRDLDPAFSNKRRQYVKDAYKELVLKNVEIRKNEIQKKLSSVFR